MDLLRLEDCKKNPQALYAKQHEACGLHPSRYALQKSAHHLKKDLKNTSHGFSWEGESSLEGGGE
jgi:hypothetical protein